MSNHSGGTSNPHVLVFPYPAQGHMLPLLDLTHQLALRGLAITVLVTPKNSSLLDSLLSAHPSVQKLVFPFPGHPSLPPGVENVKDIGNAGNCPIICALSKLHDPIVQWFESHPSPPVAIISDFFLGWTQFTATQIGVPRLVFYSSGAFLVSVVEQLWKNIDSLRASKLSEVTFPDLPRSPSFAEEQLPSLYRRYVKSDPDWEIVRSGYAANMSNWGAIFNTFDGLEHEYLDYLKMKMGHTRVFAVGPVSLLSGPSKMPKENPMNHDVLGWLDGCEDGSVLYVCFGSQKLLKQAQMDALATGLELSGVKFVWVVKALSAQQVSDGLGCVPDGFEDRVKGRGFILKGWAPQTLILGHKAVGGFLSHCGWNSVLEAVVGGVMILGWPMEADQFVNAKLLVDYMGVAVRVCQGGDTVPESARLAGSIAEAMRKDCNEKVKAKELRDKSLAAVESGGSSTKDLHGLVHELTQL